MMTLHIRSPGLAQVIAWRVPVRLAVAATIAAVFAAAGCASQDLEPWALEVEADADGNINGKFVTSAAELLRFSVDRTPPLPEEPVVSAAEITIERDGREVYHQQHDGAGKFLRLEAGGADVLQLEEDEAQKQILREFFNRPHDAADYSDLLELVTTLALQPNGSLGDHAGTQIGHGIVHIETVFPPSEHHDAGGGRDPRYCCVSNCYQERTWCRSLCQVEVSQCGNECTQAYRQFSDQWGACMNLCHIYYFEPCMTYCSAGFSFCKGRCPI